jgi:hypothetical protein
MPLVLIATVYHRINRSQRPVNFLSSELNETAPLFIIEVVSLDSFHCPSRALLSLALNRRPKKTWYLAVTSVYFIVKNIHKTKKNIGTVIADNHFPKVIIFVVQVVAKFDKLRIEQVPRQSIQLCWKITELHYVFLDSEGEFIFFCPFRRISRYIVQIVYARHLSYSVTNHYQ